VMLAPHLHQAAWSSDSSAGPVPSWRGQRQI